MRRVVFLIASVAVSAVFLWLALRDVPVAAVVESIRGADVFWVGVSLLFVTVGLWTRAVRWRGLLGFKIPLLAAFHIVSITFLINQLPFRAGEVARSLLARQSGVPLVTAATSIVVERILDTLLVVVALAAALSRLPTAPQIATQAAFAFGAAAVAAFVVLLFLARHPARAYALLDFAERRVALAGRLPLRSLLTNVLEGLQPLTARRPLLHAVGWTLISWAFSFATLYSLQQALNIRGVDGISNAVLGVTLASFSIAVPVSVAAIGPFEGAVRVAGQAVEMPPVLATSLGFLLHGMTVLGYLIWGTLGLLAQGVSLGDTIRADGAVRS